MKFCKHCGNQLSSNINFCKNCGEPVTANENIHGATSNDSKGDLKQEHNLNTHKSISDPSPAKSRIEMRNQPTIKQKVPKWVYWIGAAVILFIVVFTTVMSGNNSNEETSEIPTNEERKNIASQADEDTDLVNNIDNGKKEEQMESTEASRNGDMPFTIQVGAFEDKENADSLVEDLTKSGYKPSITFQDSLYKVQIGANGSEEMAEEMANDLKREGYNPYISLGDTQEETSMAKEGQDLASNAQDAVSNTDKEENNKIEAPFAIGASKSELIAHYGEPDYDGYFNGGRLISFGEEGYFIDEMDETVIGYFFAKPTLNVFGATVGMTGEEINKIYQETAEPYYDDAETQSYGHPYNKNGFKIFFYSEEKDGPTTSVTVVKE